MSQFGEIKNHNYKMLPELKEQVRTSKHITQSNDKPWRKDSNYFNKLYNTYNGKNYEYIMRNNANRTGNDFYQIKEVGSNPAYSNQIRALGPEPNNIIPSSVPNYNSQVGNSQKLYGGVEMNVEKVFRVQFFAP